VHVQIYDLLKKQPRVLSIFMRGRMFFVQTEGKYVIALSLLSPHITIQVFLFPHSTFLCTFAKQNKKENHENMLCCSYGG